MSLHRILTEIQIILLYLLNAPRTYTSAVLSFVPWSLIFYLIYFLKAIQNCSFVHQKSTHANDVRG